MPSFLHDKSAPSAQCGGARRHETLASCHTSTIQSMTAYEAMAPTPCVPGESLPGLVHGAVDQCPRTEAEATRDPPGASVIRRLRL